MPLHDWSPMPAGLYHDFHQTWSVYLKNALNSGILPPGLSALVEQRQGPREADVLTLKSWDRRDEPSSGPGVATVPRPKAYTTRKTDAEFYGQRANRIVVHRKLGEIIAVIEIVSPGNKSSRKALAEFISKTIAYLDAGIHVLVVDPFPPTKRDPFGMHKAIWDEVEEEPFEFPTGKDRLAVSYEAGEELAVYIDTFGVGDGLPSALLCLTPDARVRVPLETTYREAFAATPEVYRRGVETGKWPEYPGE